MIKRVLTLLVAATALFAVASPAQGQQYPPEELFITSCATAVPGGECTVTSGFWDPGSTTSVTVRSQPVNVGSTTADADGVSTLTFVVPDNLTLGTHTITVTGFVDGLPVDISTTFEVVAPGAPPAAAGALPRTGDNTVPVARIGAALVAIGGGLMFVTRRRRAAAAA